MESIFESLENLNVSEECFNEIMGIVEAILDEEDVYEPAAYAKDGYNFMATGSNKLNGKLYKVHTKHDKGVTKTKLYAKDGDSARKLVQKAYGGPDSAHTLANESLYNDIVDIVEAMLSEGSHLLGVVNRYAKKRGYLVPNYLELEKKAYKLPGTNDLSYNRRKKFGFEFHGDVNKDKSKDERGQERNDKRHVESGRSKDELEKNRKQDEERNFVKASIKSALRKNKEYKEKIMESIFENLENLNVSEECFEEILRIVEAILDEGKEPFETTMDYKQRLQKHFGPILNDKMAAQKSIAKHYNKKAKGLSKEVKKAEGERDTAAKEENKAREKWSNSWKIANAMGDVYGYDSDIYKETKEGKDKASKKLEKAENNTKKAWKKLEDIRGKKYDAENSADIARGNQDEISHKIWKTGTSYYRHK